MIEGTELEKDATWQILHILNDEEITIQKIQGDETLPKRRNTLGDYLSDNLRSLTQIELEGMSVDALLCKE